MARNIHFVGSIKLADSAAVFSALAGEVGSLAPRYPDGETGQRENWLLWQRRYFEEHADFEAATGDASPMPTFRLRADVDPAAVHFPDIGYARVALASYREFRRLGDDGVVPDGTRFQVSLPTPLAVVAIFVDPAYAAAVEPAYDQAMQRELREICEGVPADDLAIQWDVCLEVTAHDGGRTVHDSDPLGHASATVAKMIDLTGPSVETGVHLCYGDSGHKHIIEPHDLATSVLFANSITEAASRSLSWVHVAVPRDRDDEAYFAPLADLAIDRAELALGLLHHTDGIDGARRRMEAAASYISEYAVATECGFGRRPPDTIPALLALHADAARS